VGLVGFVGLEVLGLMNGTWFSLRKTTRKQKANFHRFRT
jgi:hypothetical protein